MTQFTTGWDSELAGEMVTEWVNKGYIAGSLIDVNELVGAVDAVLRAGATVNMPSVVVAPRMSVAGDNSRESRQGSEEHTSEPQSLKRNYYAVLRLTNKK